MVTNNISTQAKRALRKAPRLARTVATGSPEPVRPLPVDRDRVIVRNKAHLIELARKVAPLADPLLDLDVFCNEVAHYGASGSLTSGDIMRRANVLCLLASAL